MNNKMQWNLKPCPFCGQQAELVPFEKELPLKGRDYPPEYQRRVAVVCQHCFAEGASDLGESGAVEAWNSRIQEPSVHPLTLHEFVLNMVDYHCRHPQGDVVKAIQYDKLLNVVNLLGIGNFAILQNKENPYK